MPSRTLIRGFDRSLRWLAPSGNLGDSLILSGLLRARHLRTGERFGMLRLPPHSALFLGHPAVAQIASVDAIQMPLQRTDYWDLPFSGKKAGLRPWAKLSLLLFGEVLEEGLPWAPLRDTDHEALRGLPFSRAPVLVAPAADSPRGEWPIECWQALVAALSLRTSCPIVQLGLAPSARVRGALDMTGKLQLRSLLALVSRAQLLISVDPLLTQAAAAFGVPALNLFGPTSAALYGHPSQSSVEHRSACDLPCLDVDRSERAERCPERRFCMTELSCEQVLGVLEPELGRLDPERPLRAA